LISLVEKKRIFSIQENHPAHPAQTPYPVRQNISGRLRFLLIGSLACGIDGVERFLTRSPRGARASRIYRIPSKSAGTLANLFPADSVLSLCLLA
jgi:hypothetical protein